MTSQDQLGFEAMLADAAETNAKRAFEKETAHLPDTEEDAIAYHKVQIAAHHAAMLACDFNKALSIREEAHLLAKKLNDGNPGILAHDDAPGYVLARACEAEDGTVPRWGQDGVFDINVTGADCRVTFQGMFGIGATAMPYLGFEVRAVNKSRPFISGTGYRSFLGCSVPPEDGMTPKDFAAKIITHYAETGLKGKLINVG
ncbi:MAG: hypothetical protein AAFZ46_11095 [Pseudomonadota bacterium]